MVIPPDQWLATDDVSEGGVIYPAPLDMLPDISTVDSETSPSPGTPEVHDDQTVTGGSRSNYHPAPMTARPAHRATRRGKCEPERIVWCGNRGVNTRLISKEVRIKCCKMTSSLALKHPEETCHC